MPHVVIYVVFLTRETFFANVTAMWRLSRVPIGRGCVSIKSYFQSKQIRILTFVRGSAYAPTSEGFCV